LKKEKIPFAGFDNELFVFFKDLENNNSVEWFHENYERYQNYLVIPARGFVTELAPFLNRLNPSIRTEPKFNETLMRLNKDMRFAKGAPYRNYFLIHFGRFKLDSEFYLYFEPNEFDIGLFLNNTKGENLYFRQNLKKFKKEILEVCEKYKINDRFGLHQLNKAPEKILSKFNAVKHYSKLEEIDLILLQKEKRPSLKTLSSSAIVVEMIKMISMLYPLYCFAISPQPLKLLSEFEDNFGEAI
jgi:hypothetical protein